MRRITLALAVALICAAPALGSDIGRKHQIDTKIASLKDRLAAQKQREQALRTEVAGYTSRIRSLEAKVGDVSLRLSTLESDLSLHQGRLDALNALFTIQSRRFEFLRAQYVEAVKILNTRLVDIYESEPASTIDLVLGRTVDPGCRRPGPVHERDRRAGSPHRRGGAVREVAGPGGAREDEETADDRSGRDGDHLCTHRPDSNASRTSWSARQTTCPPRNRTSSSTCRS